MNDIVKCAGDLQVDLEFEPLKRNRQATVVEPSLPPRDRVLRKDRKIVPDDLRQGEIEGQNRAKGGRMTDSLDLPGPAEDDLQSLARDRA